ncbi:DUF362 domain-containing protein [Heliophilum fasciatum]|uniref:DUF362 domain-containing protein n=1 Tax=Heliophilum fasciatum TaxID=35700 RepID=UPI0010463FCF|nr:4Fe-4S binding protein [Heliophilum fasciatum]MCW2278962.1 NAD-dependent dihydropyrimidine dehydrogenase PreA subunit [Heliophilum fasciatum]
MTYKITNDCTACGACVEHCCVSAISEGNPIFSISDDCVDCGVCQDVCPNNAIIAG